MRNFKDSYKGQAKVKERKNRPARFDDFYDKFFRIFKQYPEFMSEDEQYNIDAELEMDFILA